ncbi:GNAT family N-acetyltransferase [Belnapia mucosa]|nr:GNAT family N-acetyltransferase [Belnapia mucosa]
MTNADLPAVLALAAALHPHHPESPAVFAERLALAPEGCWVLGEGRGYAVAHPWAGAPPPPLDTLLGALPASPDALHLHDIALEPGMQGAGHAAAFVADLLRDAEGRGLRRATLVAVDGKDAYWARQGFRPLPGAAGPALASYGPDAVAMARLLA